MRRVADHLDVSNLERRFRTCPDLVNRRTGSAPLRLSEAGKPFIRMTSDPLSCAKAQIPSYASQFRTASLARLGRGRSL